MTGVSAREANRRPATLPVDRGSAGGGSLIALCGTQGGVGTTTLTLLLARSWAPGSRRRLLVADCGGPAAALAAYAGVGGSLSLGEASERLLAGRIEGRFVGAVSERLDILATEATVADAHDPAGLTALLGQATEAYEATLIDCGTLQREIERQVAAHATHAVWIARGDRAGALRTGSGLGARPRLGQHEELLVVRAPDGDLGKGERRRFGEVAAARPARLVLWPGLTDPLGANGSSRAGAALAALRGALC